jgi:AraC family transcriptional regulator
MASLTPVLPVLVHIQANLDGDLSLQALANRAAYSPYHFHRMFRAAVGESLKDYTLRLRLERAAFRLLLHAGSLLEVAAESGFRSHASFTRAFRRHFATTPSGYRRAGRQNWAAARRRRPRSMELPSASCEVSQTRLVALRSTHLAFIRHVGSYESVSEKLWDELLDWAAARRLPGPPVLLGIGHDAPGTTPAERLRFDAALRVTGPFPADGRIGYQEFAAGDFAVTTHVGHYSTLGAAYRLAFERLLAMRGVHVIGLPAVEVYQETRIDPSHTMNHTDIYIPVEKR